MTPLPESRRWNVGKWVDRVGQRVSKNKRGVAPVGHPEPLPTIIDIALSQYDEVWAAGGYPHYVFPTSYEELLRIIAGQAAAVGA